MPTLTVAGHDVTVGDGFDKLSPEDQQAMVNHIAQHLPGEKTSEAPSGVVAGFQHGLAGVVNGPASTVGLTGLNTPTVDGPANYKSAPIFDKDGIHPGNIMQSLAEAAPGLATDIAAGKTAAMVGNKVGGVRGGVVGGLGGFMGSALLRNFGPGAHENADARTGVPNSPVEGRDMTREAGKQALEAVPNMFVGGRMVPGAAKEAAGNVLAKLLKTGAIGGAAGAANDVIDQVGTTAGSKDGIKYDPLRTANSAATGALLNTALASPKAASEASANRKFAGYEATPETTAAAQAVANRRSTYADGRGLVGPLGGTKVAAEAANGAHKDIHSELADATRNETLSQDNTNTLDRINAGHAVSPGQVSALGKEATPETMHLVQQALISKNENARGNLSDKSYTGGIGGAMENLPIIRTPIKAAMTTGGAALLGALGVPGVGHAVGAVALPAAAATAGVYGAGRMIDRLTGARSPAQAFADRFGGTEAPTRLMTPPPADDPLNPSAGPWGSRGEPGIPSVAPPADAEPKQPSLRNTLNANVKIDEGIGKIVKRIQADKQSSSMAELRALVASQPKPEPVTADVPAPAPAPPFAPSPIAKSMLLAKLKSGLPPEPAPETPASAPAPEAPNLSPVAMMMLKQKLKAGLPPEPAVPATPPAAPVAAPAPPAVTAPQAAPTIAQLITRMKATSAAKAAQNPAATPPGGVVTPTTPAEAAPASLPTPPVTMLKKLKGQAGVTEKTGPAEYMDPDTGEMLSHTPLTKDQLWGRNMSHDEFAARETANKMASADPAKDPEVYHAKVVGDRIKREHELQLLSQHEAGPDDVPLAKLLLQELHHHRYGDDARSAAKFYGSHMSPPMRAAAAKLMDGPLNKMWSKDSEGKYAPKTKYQKAHSTNEHMPARSVLHKLKLMEAGSMKEAAE